LEEIYLHDADILSMGQEGNTFVIVLQLDAPPHNLLTLLYSLAGEPLIDRSVLPPQYCSPRPQWLHEELEVVEQGGGERHFVHSILLSNGWQLRLPFRDVQMTYAKPVFPVHDVPPTAQSA
jgi:hypothetical protein